MRILLKLSDVEQSILDAMLTRRPDLQHCTEPLLAAHAKLVDCFDNMGTLFTCGNGGSNADAVHIVGELCKSFERNRPLESDVAARLRGLPYGEELAKNLESGFRAHTLGLNSALKTAIENDSALNHMAFGQELAALMRPGDLLLAISTSGSAQNCIMAMSVAKAIEGNTIVLTGPEGGIMGKTGGIVIYAPGDSTKVIQEAHIVIWHTLCLLVEAHYFTEPRSY